MHASGRKDVDADEELAAITYMATRDRENAGAAVREYRRRPLRLAHPHQHAGLEQGALCARGRARSRSLDRRDDRGDAHDHEPADRAGRDSEIQGAGERGGADRRRDRPDRIPGAEILAGRRRPLHRHRRHHVHRLARHRPHQRRLLPADAAWAAPRRALLLARQARPARPRGVVGARQAVRGGRRLWHRSGAVHAGRAGVRRQGIRARRRRRHDGPRRSS